MFNNYNQLIAFYRLSSKRRDVSRSSVTASNSSEDIGSIKFIGGLFANNSLQEDSSSEDSASEGSSLEGSSSEPALGPSRANGGRRRLAKNTTDDLGLITEEKTIMTKRPERLTKRPDIDCQKVKD